MTFEERKKRTIEEIDRCIDENSELERRNKIFWCGFKIPADSFKNRRIEK